MIESTLQRSVCVCVCACILPPIPPFSRSWPPLWQFDSFQRRYPFSFVVTVMVIIVYTIFIPGPMDRGFRQLKRSRKFWTLEMVHWYTGVIISVMRAINSLIISNILATDFVIISVNMAQVIKVIMSTITIMVQDNQRICRGRLDEFSTILSPAFRCFSQWSCQADKITEYQHNYRDGREFIF